MRAIDSFTEEEIEFLKLPMPANPCPSFFANGVSDVQMVGQNCIRILYFQHSFSGPHRMPMHILPAGEIVMPLISIGATRGSFTRKIWALGLNPDGSRRL